MITPAPDTAWFSVAEDKRRLVFVNCSIAYTMAGVVLAMFLLLGVVYDSPKGIAVAVAAILVSGLGAVLHVLMLLRQIRSTAEVVGVERRGLWWHEAGRFAFFAWEELRIVQLRHYTNIDGRTDASLDLHTFQPRPPGEPIVDRLARQDCYRIELSRVPRGWQPGSRIGPQSRTAGPIRLAITTVRPDKFVGPG